MNLPDDVRTTISATRAKVRYAMPWWLRPFLMRGVVGITLGRRIYLAPGFSGESLARFLRHELMHVRQIERLGIVRFYWRYLVEFVRNLRAGMAMDEAYRRISFEIEAVAAEDV